MDNPTVIAGVDAENVETLASSARAGTHVHPPLPATNDPMEIGRRIIAALDAERANALADDATRHAAYSNIRALSVTGAAVVARRILKAVAPFRIKRHGQVITITGAFSVPSHLVANGTPATPSEDEDAPSFRRTQYIQPDFATWELIEWVRDHLAKRRDGLAVTVAMFDQILKLKDLDGYAGLSPRAAMLKAGLDPKTMELDLDAVLASLDGDDVRIDDAAGGTS